MSQLSTSGAVLVATIAVMLAGCSLVETGPSPSPARYTGRVELADENVALTLDSSWWAEPGPSYEGLVPAPTHEIVSQVFYEHGPAGCDLSIDRETDLSSGSLVEYTERLIRDFERDGDVAAGTYEGVDLPAGPAMRVRIESARVNPMPNTQYVLQHDGVVYRLACSTFDPRDDDWLSIAEGIEFLSAAG